MKLMNHNMARGDGIGALLVFDEEYGSGKSTQSKRVLFQTLLNLKMDKSLDEVVFKINDLRGSLRLAHKVDLDDDLTLSVFLSGLNAQYDPIKTVLEVTKTTTMDSALEACKNFRDSTKSSESTSTYVSSGMAMIRMRQPQG